jgi:hypothetical protein
MDTSDTVLEHPVELTDSDLDTVAAGFKTTPTSPIAALEDDIKDLVQTILSDVGLGKPGISR